MGKTASIRDLHMKTSDIVNQVEGGGRILEQDRT